MSNVQAAAGVVNLSEGDPGLVNEIRELGGEELLECIQCAKCAAACPMVLAGFPFFNKKVIHAILLGLREDLLDDSSIWACQSCNRCSEICPREVNPFEVIQAMRRVAIREFALPTLSVEGLKSLYDTGHAVYVSGAGGTRARVGLPEEPPSTVRDKKALEELQKLMRKTALAELGIIPMGESGIRESCEV